MNIRNLILMLLGGAGAFALVRAIMQEQHSVAERTNARVVSVVEETLLQHGGEGDVNPIVHAFEEALERKAHA